MSDLIVIGLCGKPGAGKDTAGNHIGLKYGFTSRTIKEPIEEAVRSVFGVREHSLYCREAREQLLEEWPGWTVRKLLQGVAQSLRDLVGEHLWAQAFCMRLDKHLESRPYKNRITVTDVRTTGDVVYIKQHVLSKGGRFYLLMVNRPGYGATTSGGFANHKLESYDLSESCDHIFENDGTVDQLWGKVDDWMETIGFSRWQPKTAQEEEDARIFEMINELLPEADPHGKPVTKQDLVKAFASVASHSIAVRLDGVFGDPQQLKDLHLWDKAVFETNAKDQK